MNRKAFSLIEISVVIVIVGILIAGITAGVGMYKDTILTSARTLTINSRVQRINGLALWLETTLNQSFNSTFNMQNGQLTHGKIYC